MLRLPHLGQIKKSLNNSPITSHKDWEIGGLTYRTITRDKYYYDADTNVILILAKPSAISINLKFTQQVVAQVKSIVDGMELQRYGPDLKIEYGGS